MTGYVEARDAYRNRLADEMTNLKRLDDSDLALLFLRFGESGADSLSEREQRVFAACLAEMAMRFPRLAEENATLLTELQALYGAEDAATGRRPYNFEDEEGRDHA